MVWFVLVAMVVLLVLVWASHMKGKEGALPTKSARPAPMGVGFRAASDSELTRLAETGYRWTEDDNA